MNRTHYLVTLLLSGILFSHRQWALCLNRTFSATRASRYWTKSKTLAASFRKSISCLGTLDSTFLALTYLQENGGKGAKGKRWMMFVLISDFERARIKLIYNHFITRTPIAIIARHPLYARHPPLGSSGRSLTPLIFAPPPHWIPLPNFELIFIPDFCVDLRAKNVYAPSAERKIIAGWNDRKLDQFLPRS
jgi:hypothetical protein